MTEERGQETFLAKIMKGWRLTIYHPIRESLDAEIGDLLRVTVKIEKRKKDLRKSPQPMPVEPMVEPEALEELEEIVEEEPLPEVEDEPVEVEESTPEKLVEPTPEELPEEEIVEPEIEEPLEEEKPEGKVKESSWGQEHVDPCVEGLDWPLQDIGICRGQGCDFYRRKYKKNPERCIWKGWLRVGWEDEVEEPEEESIAEPEPEEIEEPIETKENQIVLIYCDSGPHKSGLIPHEKRDVGDGWAMYTCLSCKKTTPMVINQVEEKVND